MKPIIILFLFLTIISCKDNSIKEKLDENKITTEISETKNNLIFPEEKHFKTLRQVTFGGDNAEAYWSFDDKQLVFQSNNKAWGLECDQMFLINFNDTFKDKKPPMVSTGKGRTTCSYFLPDNKHIIYASTHLVDEDCPEVPLKKDGKYVWPVYDSFDIFVADLQGNITAQLTNEKGYDAEPTVSPKGDKIVFTSTRSGDLELYTMNIDGSNVKQITFELGYDGGAFFSPDGSQIIFRSSRPKTEEEIKEYKDLLANGLVQPTQMELYICNADGSNLRQLTHLGNANWAPFFHPSGKKVLFSSNFESKRGFPFNLYMIDTDGKNLEKVTHSETFDAFPVFSNNGKYLVFSSNRNNGGGHDTNLFIAEWQD
ncbi:MAG: TolB family protein [Flavobacteriales bacterium]